MLGQVMSRQYPAWVLRVARIILFTVLIVISAKIAIPIPGTPVPITTQTLAILLTGMVLGPVEGVISVVVYLGMIAVGLPLDAFSRGAAAFAGPTAGYLIGFLPAAFIAGLAWRAKEKYKLLFNIVLGILGAATIELCGMVGLYLLGITHGSWIGAFSIGVVPFVFVDSGKAILVATLVNLGRQSWLRWIMPQTSSDARGQ